MRISHLAFRTRRLEALEHFYAVVLQLPVSRRTETGVWLDVGEAILMLETASGDEPGVPRGSLEFLAFDIESEQRIGYLRRLSEAGIAIEAQSEFTLYFRDPDGRRVGLSHYPRRAQAAPHGGS